MAAPFPYESVAEARTDPAEAEAMNLYRQYAWIARLSDEMNNETVVDLKRTMQIVFHCRQFRRWYDVLQARIGKSHTAQLIADVIESVFATKKCRWLTRLVLQQDLSNIYAEAGALADWIEANAAEYKQGYSVNKEVSPGVMTDEPIKRFKSEDIATRISNFRALFGPKG
jgi:hypothetical protein